MFLLPVLIILAIVIIDQITKYMTVSMLMPINSVEIIKNFFSLTYIENRGAAFGTMMGGRWFFVALTVIVVVAGGIYYSKIYNKDKYTDADSLNYFKRGMDHYIINPNTKELLYSLLVMLSEKGEDYTFAYIRRNILHNG